MKPTRAWVELAERQHGLITLEQAVGSGLGKAAAWNRLERERWEPTGHPGVYRIPGSRRSWEQRVLALVLAAGPGAAASHRSAAALHGFAGFARGGLVEVTTERPMRHRRSSDNVHSSRVLPPSHVTVVDGIPVTTIARTIFDLAGLLHPRRIERILDSCLSAQQVTIADLRAVMLTLGKRGRRGTALLRRLLEVREVDGYVAPASELESLFVTVAAAAGLPDAERQVDVGDEAGWIGRVDFLYRVQRVIVELDGRRYHSSLLDLEADRVRDNRLVAAGWRVIRITWEQLTTRPDEVIEILKRALGLAAA